jgi:hypothetical protein
VGNFQGLSRRARPDVTENVSRSYLIFSITIKGKGIPDGILGGNFI